MQPDRTAVELMNLFVERMRGRGYAYKDDVGNGRYRHQLAALLDERHIPGEPLVTQQVAEEWIARRGDESEDTRYARWSILHLFTEFLVTEGLGEGCYILPLETKPARNPKFVPYIFTHAEIEDLTDAFDSIKPHGSSPIAHIVKPALFRTIYGCGLRSSEARLLDLSHVDLESGVLSIVGTKNNADRYVPMNEALTEYLRGYVSELGIESGPLFPGRSGNPYSSQNILVSFQAQCERVGIVNREGKSPRVHDLRHTFAVHSLQAAIDAGTPSYAFLPVLATYMGHKNIKETEYYLHLTLEGQKRAIDLMEAAYGPSLYPEVAFDA